MLGMSLLATMIVFEFPPRLSLRSQVRTESRYGMKRDFFLGPPGLWDDEMSAEGNKPTWEAIRFKAIYRKNKQDYRYYNAIILSTQNERTVFVTCCKLSWVLIKCKDILHNRVTCEKFII